MPLFPCTSSSRPLLPTLSVSMGAGKRSRVAWLVVTNKECNFHSFDRTGIEPLNMIKLNNSQWNCFNLTSTLFTWYQGGDKQSQGHPQVREEISSNQSHLITMLDFPSSTLIIPIIITKHITQFYKFPAQVPLANPSRRSSSPRHNTHVTNSGRPFEGVVCYLIALLFSN